MIPLEERIRRGREAIARAQAEGKNVSDWIERLAKLEAELAHQAEALEITHLMQSQGWALVWSDTLGETIASARNDTAASQVPGGIVVYTSAELESVLGQGPAGLRLIHEGKKRGAKVIGKADAL